MGIIEGFGGKLKSKIRRIRLIEMIRPSILTEKEGVMAVKRLRKDALTDEEMALIREEDLAYERQKLEEFSDELDKYKEEAIAMVDESDLESSVKKIASAFTQANVYSSELGKLPFTVFMDFPEKGVVRIEVTA